MAEVIDSQAREDVGKLWGAFRELAVDYWGPNRDNGRRSEVLEMLTELQELRERLRHYLDVERESTCIGMVEFAKRDAFKAEIDTEVTEVKTAEINAGAVKSTGHGQVVGMIIVAVIQFGGLLVVALMK